MSGFCYHVNGSDSNIKLQTTYLHSNHMNSFEKFYLEKKLEL